MGLLEWLMLIPFAILIVVVSVLLQSWAVASDKMKAIPGNLGWPIVGETFAFIAEFSSPAGVYNFIKKRQQRLKNCFSFN